MKNVLINIISSKYLIVIISFLFFIVTTIELVCFNNKLSNIKCNNIKEEIVLKDNSTNITKEEINETKEEFIYIDIKGEVKKPGVYMLPYGSIVNDVIELSGGVTKKANTRFINLSKKVYDGDVIVVYSNDEIKNATKTKTITNTVYVDTPCICEEVKNDACIIETIKEENKTIIEEKINENNSNNEVVNDSKLININTANEEELTTLSGIGASKAKAIIEYRNTNGNFKSIEEIINVSGISETIFSKIKESITV